MALWVWIVLLAAMVKLPIAALLLWMPFRYDEAMKGEPPESTDSSEEDGGSKALPAGPLNPHPRSPRPPRPRRGPHGSSSPPAPSRVRRPAWTGRPLRTG